MAPSSAPAVDAPSAPQSAPQPDPGPSLFGEAPAIRKPRPRREEPSNTLLEEDDVLVMEPEEEGVTAALPSEMQAFQRVWDEVVEEVMASEKQLGSFLRHARLLAFEGKFLLVSVPDEFHARALRNERAKLAHRLTEGTDQHVERIGFKVDAPASSDPDLADDELSAKETLEMLCEENPAVRALVERFGGEIVW